MPGAGKEFAVLVFSHFFSSFFNDAAQLITSNHKNFYYIRLR